MKKKTRAILSLVICLVLGALRAADLCLLSDPATGFVRVGEAWFRYAAVAAAAAALFVLSRAASVSPEALRRPKRALGLAMLLTAALMLETGLSSWMVLQRDSFSTLRGALLLLSGLWFAVFGVRALFEPARRPAPAALGLAALAAPIWVAVERFAVRPSSLARTGHVLQVLSVLAALCFLAALLKVFFLPDAPLGRSLAFTGMLAFLLCTCIELPQTAISLACGASTLLDLALSGCWGAVGLCGLVSALYTAGRDRAALPPEPQDR
ncbi:MAG TPA: hypothetical protein H9915_01385 [Candidatus Gemmiger faecigallinarum]|nr:hypothetical protein [Candidatus Gemmiger faecigallinarum]